jgi:hypothetical protein
MGTSAWLAPVAGLVGVMLGGLVSYAVSYQQIREARSQRADEANQERQRRSEDRRFKVYADFILSHRAVQNALHFYYSQTASKPAIADIDSLLQAGYNSSAMVFLVAETERTNKACIGVLNVLDHAQEIIYKNVDDPARGKAWPKLNVTLGRAMREFENAARAELNVNGPEWTWVERQQARLDREPAEHLPRWVRRHFETYSSRLLVDLSQDRCLARLGLGARLVALISAARAGRVALIWPARAGRRGQGEAQEGVCSARSSGALLAHPA